MADLKTTNIFGDAYINNKVGIATNAPATRLQIGQLSPTAATEGIQFGDDTNTRIYRGASGQINFNGTINVLGNTYLGDANGDTVFVNDTIRIGATDSGDASLFFGEGSVAGSDYGARWYWDSGYTFTWYKRNNGTDTALFDYVTNDLNYINWRRHFHMQNKEINYNAQIHFNAGTRFVGNNTSYLNFRSDSAGAGGILVQDGNATTKGYTGYWDSAGGGILNNSGNWAVRYNFGSANSGGTLYGAWTVNGNISATNLSGTNTGDQTIGNGTITIAAGTGIGVGTTNTFTMNQSGATTVTITNSGVTSNVAGTGISVSGATGAVTITNSSPNATHTGDVTGATALTIANDAVTTVKILNANVTNAKLANSSLTIGSTAISLGATATTIAGLTSVTSTTFVGALTGNATTATALTSMNISQFTNNSGYLTSAVTSLAGTTNRITVSGATGAVTLNLPQDIHTGASPTFAGLSLTSVSTTGATITNLTGAYQNTTVYDSPRTQSATPSRGIRAPASSIQFTDSYAIAPFYTYRSTGDWPVPYGIGWGTGGESSGIFQRYASNGSSFGDMIFYTGNDGSGAFSFRRHVWESTTYFAAGSNHLNDELFRIDWAGKATATSFALPGGFTITDPGSGYAAFSNWVLLGTTGFYSATNSAHLLPNPGTYGSWKITGTRGGWYGIEFESGVSLMANSNQVGFHRNGYGWQMWWSAGTGYVHKGDPGGGTQATILDSSNYTSYTPGLGTNNTLTGINTINNTSNTVINTLSGNLGLTMFQATAGTDAYMTFHIGSDYAAYFGLGGAENDLVYGGWSVGNVRYRILHSGNATYAWNMNQYVRTTDTCSFAGLTVSNTINGSVTGNAGGSSTSCTGNATTATTLQTGRTINGTSFNGSAAITTANWGTARTLTIGSTGKSVDGSAAITWSLAEIGAAATNQTMFVGTTSVAINRASAAQTLTGVNIDGNAASATYARRLDDASRSSFTVGGNKDNYYPVFFAIGAGSTALQYSEFVIERGGYDDPGYTFAGGNTFSTLNIRFSCKASGWGFGATYENVEMHGYTTQLVANWQQMSEQSILIVWLRGATIYNFWNVVGNTTLVNGNSGGTSLTLVNAPYYNYTYAPTTTVQTKALYGKYINSSTGTSGIYVAGNVLAEGLFSGPGTGLTGTAAGLSIGGNAGTATILQTARNINGTSFDGSAAITTANWGTARTLTIGSTGKSVDGSTAITWSLAEIGAAATNQTMFIGTTSVAINRASTSQTLTGVSIDGNAATATSATSATSASFATTAATATNVSIANGSVALAKIENITAYTILGNSNASSAATPAALSVATVATMLSGQTMNINGSSTSISGFGNPATTATANTIAYRDANGDLSTRYFFGSYQNSSDDINTGNISHIMAKFGDNYHRSATAAKVAAFISGQTMNIAGSSTSCTGNAATATNATTAGGLAVQSGTNYDANKIVRTDGNGYILAGWINTISGDNGTTAIDRVYASQDGYIRYYTPANFRTVLDVPTRNGSGVTNFGINTAPSNRLHINGDGTNPAIRVDNGAVVLAASAASNSKTFYGWLPISIAGTTKWIQMYN
jgi:hypothetical protein